MAQHQQRCRKAPLEAPPSPLAAELATSSLLREHNATRDGSVRRRRPRTLSPSVARVWPSVCAAAGPGSSGSSSDEFAPAGSWPRCTDDRAKIEAAGVRILVGIQSDPRMPTRRAGIRSTWKLEDRSSAALVCFVLGRLGPSTAQLRQMDAEEARYGDVLWLHNVTDGCTGRPMGMAKMVGWWRAASRLLGRTTTHAVKVDDDTHLMLPRLAADLGALGCVHYLYLGALFQTRPLGGVLLRPRRAGSHVTCAAASARCRRNGVHLSQPPLVQDVRLRLRRHRPLHELWLREARLPPGLPVCDRSVRRALAIARRLRCARPRRRVQRDARARRALCSRALCSRLHAPPPLATRPESLLTWRGACPRRAVRAFLWRYEARPPSAPVLL